MIIEFFYWIFKVFYKHVDFLFQWKIYYQLSKAICFRFHNLLKHTVSLIPTKLKCQTHVFWHNWENKMKDINKCNLWIYIRLIHHCLHLEGIPVIFRVNNEFAMTNYATPIVWLKSLCVSMCLPRHVKYLLSHEFQMIAKT